MSLKIIFKQLINLSANEDYLKKIAREIRIISLDDQGLVMEISSCLAAKNNSILIDFLVQKDLWKLEVEMTCKIIEFESSNNVGRLSLRLIQYNKKEWNEFRALLADKQNHAEELLKNLRGR